MKLNVPYYSQYLDIADSYWMLRGCSVTCLKIVMEYHGISKTIDELIKRGQEIGAYGKSGWIHDSLVDMAKENGLKAYREEGMNFEIGVKKLSDELRSSNPVIVSGIKHFFGQKKFHTVVLTGFKEEKGSVTGFYYHDTESTKKDLPEGHPEGAENRFVDLDTFNEDWRRMAIFISK